MSDIRLYGADQATQNMQIRPGNSVHAAVEAFDAVLQRLESQASKLQEISDRVNGSKPRPTDPMKEPNPPESLIQSVRHRRDRAVKIADAIERELRALGEGLWSD